MSVVALVIAPTVAINVDDIGDKVDKTENLIQIKAEKVTEIEENIIRYEEVVKK